MMSRLLQLGHKGNSTTLSNLYANGTQQQKTHIGIMVTCFLSKSKTVSHAVHYNYAWEWIQMVPKGSDS